MTKEQFLKKWVVISAVKDKMLPDLEAVIATEIAKAKVQPQPALNPIEQAYHAFQPIRYILWKKGWRIKKHSDTESIDANGRIFNNTCFVFNFDTNPEKWELYTEPAEQVAKPTEQPSSQVKLDNSFDKDRFEAMFRAVVANGGHELDHKQAIELTEEALKQLDVYYAEKEGGNNE